MPPPALEASHAIPPTYSHNSTPVSGNWRVANHSVYAWNANLMDFAGSVQVTENLPSGTSFHPQFIALAMEDVSRAFFDVRANRWINDTAWFSSISTITRHPDFAAIVGMGNPAAKLILE